MANNPDFNLHSSLSSLLKSIIDSEPYGVMSGIDEAWGKLSTDSLTSLGPLGGKLLLDDLVVEHPTAKDLVQAAKEQRKKFRDGANLLLSIAGQHLKGAKELMTKDGLKPSQIITCYNKASNKVGEILEDLVENMSVMNTDEIILHLEQCAYNDNDIFLCPLIAKACIQVCPKNPLKFNEDNVRVAVLLGANLRDSTTFGGMVLNVDTVVGSIKTIEDADVLVVAGGVDTANIKTHRVYSDETLGNYAQTEEAKVIIESGAKVIVSGARVGQMALRFCNDNEIMVLEVTSQNELDCFCLTTNAVALSELKSVVHSSYLGKVDSISVEKTHGARVTVTKEQGCVATVLLGLERPDNIYYEQLEKAVVNGVKIYKALCKDSRIVPGAGATEIEIAKRLKEFSLEQNGSSSDAIAISKYAESFELIPKTLAKNSYLDVEDIMKNLKADHEAGKVKVGIDVKEGACKDASTLKIWDLYTTKYQALQYAADAVCKALKVVDEAVCRYEVLQYVADESDLESAVHSSYLGKVDSISVEKTHGARVTVTKKEGCVATVLLGLERADNIYYGQLEKAVANGVQIYKALCKDNKIVPGAGATEFEIAKRLKEFSLEQNGSSSSDAIAIAKYAESFELIPTTLAKNSYLDV